MTKLVETKSEEPTLPTIVISFPHPAQPEFQFVNWENAVSVGNLERMTHYLFAAAQRETLRIRREHEKET